MNQNPQDSQTLLALLANRNTLANNGNALGAAKLANVKRQPDDGD